MRVWSIDRPGEPVVLRGHEKAVFWAAWSPDSKRIVTASVDKTARVWNADGSGEPVVFRDHEEALRFAVFSPDGERILTFQDETARVWNADGSGEPYVLSGHGAPVVSAAWSPDGTRIVTRVLNDPIAWVWPVRAPLRGTDDDMSIKRRIALLSVSEARAHADQDACERRVQAAGAAATKPSVGGTNE